MFFVYIIANKDKKLYVGHTNNLKNRLVQHNQKQVKYTSSGIPWSLVYFEKNETKKGALSREMQIKKWSRIKKINLIKYGHPTKFLSKNNSC